MRCNDEYKALLGKINIQKEMFAKKIAEVSDETESEIQLVTEKIKKWNIRVVGFFLFSLFFIGVVYTILKYFNLKQYIGIVALILLISLIALMCIEGHFKFKLKQLNMQKKETFKEKENIRNNILTLNNQISSLIVSVITLNEHYYELASIQDNEELNKVWLIYTNQVLSAINKKYNYSPTYSDFQEYYKEYENKMKESSQENE